MTRGSARDRQPGSHAQERRAMITGMGVVSAAGQDLDAFREAIDRGQEGRREAVDLIGPVHQPRFAAIIPGSSVNGRGQDRCLALARGAVREALMRAGLAPRRLPAGSGLVVGTTLGAANVAQRCHRDIMEGRRPRLSELAQTPLHAVADHLARRFGLDGPRTVVSNACISGTSALGLAFDLIRMGEAPLVVAGGVDTLHDFNFTGFARLGLLAQSRCAPFSVQGNGALLGEAAAFLIVEEEGSAVARGTKPLAELVGHGSACDAHHVTTPCPEGSGAARAIGNALAQAGVSPEDVDFVSLHGVGTSAMDGMEARAMERVFSGRRTALPAASLRPMTGHTLGGVGALDAIACVLVLLDGKIPPTPGLNADEVALPAPLQLSPRSSRRTLSVALNTSSGFGGVNAALVLRRCSSIP